MAFSLIDRFLSRREKNLLEAEGIPTETIEAPTAITKTAMVTDVSAIEEDPTSLLYKWPLSESVIEAQHIEALLSDPVAFWNDVKGAWAGLKTDEEKNSYLETIRNWAYKHIHQYVVPNFNPNYYAEMLNALGLPLMAWVTENVLQDAVGHYWRTWFVTDPAGFTTEARNLADSMPTPETRAEYLNAIRSETEWYINDLSAQGLLTPLLDLIPIETLIFATFELWQEQVGYGNWQWLLQLPESWITKEIEFHKTIPVEDVDALLKHTEDFKDMINAANFPADFIEKNISRSVRIELLKTFFPELADKIPDEGIDTAQIAKMLGWGVAGIFGLFVISKLVGGKKGGSKTFFIPAPSQS